MPTSNQPRQVRAVPLQGASPLPWIRALAFGLITVGIGLAGHGIASAAPIDPRTLVAAMLAATVVARLCSARRHAPLHVLVGLGSFQLALHAAALFGAAPQHPAGHDISVGGWPMLVVHVAALLLGTVVLLALEAEAWSLLREGVAAVARAFRRFVVRPSRISTRWMASSALASTQWLPTPSERRPGRGTRGPPSAVRLPA